VTPDADAHTDIKYSIEWFLDESAQVLISAKYFWRRKHAFGRKLLKVCVNSARDSIHFPNTENRELRCKLLQIKKYNADGFFIPQAVLAITRVWYKKGGVRVVNRL